MKKTIATFSLAALLLGSLAAFAQTPPAGGTAAPQEKSSKKSTKKKGKKKASKKTAKPAETKPDNR